MSTGLSIAQTMVLSIVMFTGASQFAFVGVLGSGGAAMAAVPAALLLGVRNAFYGIPISRMLGERARRSARRLVTAHFVIDETTAMAVGRTAVEAQRYAFWSTGIGLFTLWVIGSLLGALGGSAIGDTDRLGVDAAVPAAFLALLWPRLVDRWARIVAVVGALVAMTLIPLAPAGVQVLAAAPVAVVAGLLPRRDGSEKPPPPDTDELGGGPHLPEAGPPS